MGVWLLVLRQAEEEQSMGVRGKENVFVNWGEVFVFNCGCGVCKAEFVFG